MVNIFSTLKSPGSELITFGPFILRWYGLLIATSVFIGLNLSIKLGKQRGINSYLISDFMPILILSSVIGARIYYVLFEWRNFSGIYFWSSIHLLNFKITIPKFIEIWGGGIAIHGALIGGFISLMIFCRINKKRFWDFLDILLPSVALGQAIGRWGNFFNNEAFGIPTELPWKLFIPLIDRPEEFLNYQYFHPTFLYESIWNIGIFILLIIVFRLGSKRFIRLPSGALSCLYIIFYSTGRIWIESLRIDSLCIGGLPPFCEGGFRIAQLISILFISIGILGILRIYLFNLEMPNLGANKK